MCIRDSGEEGRDRWDQCGAQRTGRHELEDQVGNPEGLEERIERSDVVGGRGDGKDPDEAEDARDEERAADQQAAPGERTCRGHRGRTVPSAGAVPWSAAVSYTHLRAHETR